MTKLFASFELSYPDKASRIGNMVLDYDEPTSETDISFLELKIHNMLTEDIRPIRQPTIICFKKLNA